MNDAVEKILITEEEIRAKVKELGDAITRDYAGKKLLVVTVLKGGFVFAADLVRAIRLPLETEFMVISSYNSGTKSSGHVEVKRGVERNIEDTHILIAEDILDSGNSLAFLLKYFKERRAKSVKICTLLDKPANRQTQVEAQYVGFTVPDEFIVGYGLDYAEKFRNLPYVGVLKRSVYE